MTEDFLYKPIVKFECERLTGTWIGHNNSSLGLGTRTRVVTGEGACCCYVPVPGEGGRVREKVNEELNRKSRKTLGLKCAVRTVTMRSVKAFKYIGAFSTNLGPGE